MIYKVETDTDELRIFRNRKDVSQYLADNGICSADFEMYCNGDTTIVTIPKLKAARDKYIKAKISACEKYGCE